MKFLSPMTRLRLARFRHIRRAWYALIALVAIFVFCMFADFVCPCDPREVVSAESLRQYAKPSVKRHYEVKNARYNLWPDGSITDYEGPITRPQPNDAAYVTHNTQHAAYTRVFMESKLPPVVTETIEGTKDVSFPFPPCPGHPFGIDAGGRDVYARVVHGMRIALVFGLLLAVVGIVIGLIIGAVEGYMGGITDILTQRFTEIWSSIPFLYVMIFIGSTLGRSFTVLLISYAIFNWITVSYYIRAEFLRLRMRTFVAAARVQGLSALRIVFVHILPNALTPLITLFPFLLMGAIGSLAALDFLGFGLPPMTPSCGELLQEAQQFRGAWHLVLFPSLALFVVMLLTVLVGEGLRDAFDPRQRSHLE